MVWRVAKVETGAGTSTEYEKLNFILKRARSQQSLHLQTLIG